MSDEDRLNYLKNELEQLQIKAKRFKQDKLRPTEDIAFYIQCNDYFLQRVTDEIRILEQKNGAKQ